MSILGTALPAANTLATLYEVPTGRRAVVNVAACNQGSPTARVRVALSASATPAGSEFIEYDVILNNAMSGPTVTFNVYGEMDDETKRKVVSSAVQYLTHLLGSVEQGDFQFTESKLVVRDQLIPLYNERHRLSKEEREILDALG